MKILKDIFNDFINDVNGPHASYQIKTSFGNDFYPYGWGGRDMPMSL
jgi:hypothetical protein